MECTEETKNATSLELYNIQSDVQCGFGTVTMYTESRNGKSSISYRELFTPRELQRIDASAGVWVYFNGVSHVFMVDVDKIPKDLLQAMKDKLRFNPLTDFIERITFSDVFLVRYFENPTKEKYGDVKSVPFTTAEGNDVHQWACISA